MLPARPPVLSIFHQEGASANIVVRDAALKVAAHIQTECQTGEGPARITIAMPAGQAAFRLETSPAAWRAECVTPFERPNGQRGVEFTLRSDQSSITFDRRRVRLHHVLMVRAPDWGGEIVQYEPEFIRLLEQMAPCEPTALDLLSYRGQVRFHIEHGRRLAFEKTTWDGRHRYEFEITVLPGCELRETSDASVEIVGADGQGVAMAVSASTDFAPLTPLGLDELLNDKGRERAAVDPQFAADARVLEFLAYQEKFLAGSWNYISFFARDTMIATRNLWCVLSERAKRIALESVAREVSAAGIVNVTDEWSNEMALVDAIGRFNWVYKKDGWTQARPILAEILTGTVPPRSFFDVLDNTYLFPSLLALWFNESAEAGTLESWLTESHTVQGRTEYRLLTLMRNWNYILDSAAPYIKAWQDLRSCHSEVAVEEVIRTCCEEFTGLATRMVRSVSPMGNWRDSTPILGTSPKENGPFPEDINGNLIPLAITAIGTMVNRAEALGLGDSMKAFARDGGLAILAGHFEDATRFEAASEAWNPNRIRRHFDVHISAEEMRNAARRKLESASEDADRNMLLERKIGYDAAGPIVLREFAFGERTPAGLERGISFTALLLNAQGAPVPIMHSDDVYTLMFGNPSLEEIKRILLIFFLPYPLGLGLWEDEIGSVISNAVYAPPQSWRMFDSSEYHGATIWGWPLAGLLMGGLHRAVRRGIDERGTGSDSFTSEGAWFKDCLCAFRRTVENLAHPKWAAQTESLSGTELWRFEPSVETGLARATPHLKSTPLQLWSIAPLGLLIDEALDSIARSETPL